MTTRHRSLQSLLVLRLLMVSNGLVLASVAALYAVFGSKPGGYAVAGFLGAVAIALWMAVPLTDPYRAERPGRRTW